MALYTLKSRDEALLPLLNYNGDNAWVRNQMSSLGFTPTPAQTQIYSALGRTTGAEGNGGSNFFEKRAKSIENAFGTTGAAAASAVKSGIGSLGGPEGAGTENIATQQLLKDTKKSMNDIAKKYGYNSWADWQDAYEVARNEGNDQRIAEFKDQLKEFQGQANANADRANKKAADYKDYMENNYVSQKINQDRGKFAGSAINTLSTAVDVTGLTANPLANAAQGGIEGIADELEQNGFENFDWGRAGQNAAIGAATGAVTGALNKGMSNALAKRGGNLFKGGNALTRGLNNLGSKTALGRAGSTLATGAARGAVSGAVGGATGAGLQSALNGVEFGQGVQNALQGAVQGAQQGAVTGGIMAGANMAISKTPGVGKFYNELQGAKSRWDQSGSNFDERLTNTLTSGDSAVGDWLMNKRQSNVLGTVGSIGNRISPVGSSKYNKAMDLAKRALNEFEQADPYEYEESMTNMAEAEGLDWNTAQGKKAFTEKWLKDTTRDILSGGDNREMWAGSLEDYVGAPELDNGVNPINGGTVRNAELQQLISDIRSFDQTETPTTAKGWIKKAGQRIVEDANNKGVGLSINDVSDDIPTGTLTKEQRYQRFLRQNPESAKFVANYAGDNASKYSDAQLYDAFNEMSPEAKLHMVRDGWEFFPDEYMTKLLPDDVRNIEISRNDMLNYSDDGTEPITVDEALARAGVERRNNQAPQTQPTAGTTTNAWDRIAQEAGYNNYNEALQRFAEANPNAQVNPNGMAEQVLSWLDQNPNTPTTAKEWARLAGQRAVEDINNSNLGLRIKDVSQDTAQEITPDTDNQQTKLYRLLSGERPSPTEAISEAEYGESGLANRTKRGMVADALERTGNFLEGAQSNATRAQLKDLGIESAGKAIENVRKKTGITNLETQANFAKELTGGADSLMDNVQRIALTESPDGKPFTVDTSDISAQVESVVDKYADTNTFGSQSKRNQFISNLRRDISNYDTDVLSIANRMKANAADLRGRGVTDPKPADAAKARIYTDIANKLEDLSYKSIPQGNIDMMFDTAISEMRNRAATAKANGNDKIAAAYTKTADGLDAQPRTVRAFRSYKKDFVDIDKVNEVSARAENGGAAQMGRSFGTGVKRLTGTLLQRPVNAVLAKAGGAINNLADRIDSNEAAPTTATVSTVEPTVAPSGYSTPTQLYNALSRTQGLESANQIRSGANNTNVQDATASYAAPLGASIAVPSTSVYNTLSGTPMSQTQVVATAPNSYFQATGDYWTDTLGQAASKAIDDNDIESFAALYEMYQDSLANTQKQSANQAANLNATQQANIAKLNAADSAIDELESLFEQAGGGKGPIVGNLQSIAGDWGWDSGARTYNDLSEGLVNQIAAAIGKTDSLNTEGEVKRALKLIPQLTDDATTAKNKLEELRRMLATTKASYNSAYGITQ